MNTDTTAIAAKLMPKGNAAGKLTTANTAAELNPVGMSGKTTAASPMETEPTRKTMRSASSLPALRRRSAQRPAKIAPATPMVAVKLPATSPDCCGDQPCTRWK